MKIQDGSVSLETLGHGCPDDVSYLIKLFACRISGSKSETLKFFSKGGRNNVK